MGVNVIVIQPKVMENVIFSNGTILANEAVELRSEVSGRIRNISFTEGNRVNKGDLLVKIVDDDLQAQLKKLKTPGVPIQRRCATQDETEGTGCHQPGRI